MSVAIDIAGVGLRFASDNLHADPLLRQRFAGFVSEPDDAIAVELHLTGGSPSMDASGETLTLVERHDGALVLTGDTTVAEVSGDNESASITGPLAAHAIDAVVRLLLARALLKRGALLVHASAVAIGDQGLVFVGPSGSGKTTVATTLTGQVLADEAVALVPNADRVVAHGTPYWRGASRAVALAHLLFLARGDRPKWTDVPPSLSAAKLFAAAGPLPESANAAALETATGLAQRNPRAAEVTLAQKADILAWLAPKLGAG